jgi:hypothetical protein
MGRRDAPRLYAVALALVAAAAGCTTVRYAPLHSARYEFDPMNSRERYQGVAIEVKLEQGTATVLDGTTEVVVLRLARQPDRQRWLQDCTSMSGHAMVEPATVTPTTFTLRGRELSFDTLRAKCTARYVELIDRSNHDERIVFKRAGGR